MKTCTKCRIEYPATAEYFPSHRKTKDGLSSWCRECIGEKSRECQRTKRGKAAKKQRNKRYYSTISGYLRCVYLGIEKRCSNSGCEAYKNYGGRGIKNMFKSAEEFIDYVVNALRIDPRGLDGHRIDNDGDYEPGNIEFLTLEQHGLKHKAINDGKKETEQVPF